MVQVLLSLECPLAATMDCAATLNPAAPARSLSPSCYALIGRPAANALGSDGDGPRGFFRAQRADGFAGLPHFRVADHRKLFGQLLLVVGLAAGGEHAGAFLAGLDALIKLLEDRHHGFLKTGLPVQGATLGGG